MHPSKYIVDYYLISSTYVVMKLIDMLWLKVIQLIDFNNRTSTKALLQLK